MNIDIILHIYFNIRSYSFQKEKTPKTTLTNKQTHKRTHIHKRRSNIAHGHAPAV